MKVTITFLHLQPSINRGGRRGITGVFSWCSLLCTIADGNSDMGLLSLTQEMFCCSPDVRARANKMPVMTMSLVSDRTLVAVVLKPLTSSYFIHGGGGGFSSRARIWAKVRGIIPYLRFFFFFKVEVIWRAPIPLFWARISPQ